MNNFDMDSLDSMQINVSMFDQMDVGSPGESHISSPNSSFSYAEPITPSSEPSRRPSMTPIEWDPRYLSRPVMSQHQIAQTLPCRSSCIPMMDPILVLDSQQSCVPLASPASFLNECLMAGCEDGQDLHASFVSMFKSPAQVPHWERSDIFIAQPETIDSSNAVSLSECFMPPNHDGVSNVTDYQATYEHTTRQAIPTVVPSQTVALPLVSEQVMADPRWPPIKAEPSRVPEYSIPPSSPLSNTYAAAGSPPPWASIDGDCSKGLEYDMLTSSPVSEPCVGTSSPIQKDFSPSSPTISDHRRHKRPKGIGREAHLAALKKKGGIHEDYPCRVFPKPPEANQCRFLVSSKQGKEHPCPKSFVRKEHLKRHIRTVHKVDEPNFRCDVPIKDKDTGREIKCYQGFNRSDNLDQHIRKTHLRNSPTGRNQQLRGEARLRYLSNPNSWVNRKANRQACRQIKCKL